MQVWVFDPTGLIRLPTLNHMTLTENTRFSKHRTELQSVGSKASEFEKHELPRRQTLLGPIYHNKVSKTLTISTIEHVHLRDILEQLTLGGICSGVDRSSLPHPGLLKKTVIRNRCNLFALPSRLLNKISSFPLCDPPVARGSERANPQTK